MKKKKQVVKIDEPEIEILSPSSFCTYSVVENKLRTITQNQKIIDDKLNKISERLAFIEEK